MLLFVKKKKNLKLMTATKQAFEEQRQREKIPNPKNSICVDTSGKSSRENKMRRRSMTIEHIIRYSRGLKLFTVQYGERHIKLLATF